MGSHLWLERFLPHAGLKPETSRSAGQCLTHRATAAPLQRKRTDAKIFAQGNMTKVATTVNICQFENS